MKQNTNCKKVFLFLIAMILSVNSILAFAVSSRYYEDNPLYLQPGESTETFFTLQNLASPNDVSLQARIIKGEEIIELTDSSEIYYVPTGEKKIVNFIVAAPIDAKKGDVFPVTILFTTMTVGEGPIALGGSVGKGFNLVIGEPSDFNEDGTLKTNITLIYTIVVLIAIATVLGVVFYLRKNKMPLKKVSKIRTNKF